MILVSSRKRLVALFSLLFCLAFAQQKRPNIIVILSDDVGFEEFGIYDVKKGVASLTPNFAVISLPLARVSTGLFLFLL